MRAHTNTVWVAYTNTDCTEGRGMDVPIAVCAVKATAIRLAKNRYVQGSDGPVRPVELICIDNQWFDPYNAVHVVEPTEEDVRTQNRTEARLAAIALAKAAGLTDQDLAALTGEIR